MFYENAPMSMSSVCQWVWIILLLSILYAIIMLNKRKCEMIIIEMNENKNNDALKL